MFTATTLLCLVTPDKPDDGQYKISSQVQSFR